MKTPSFWASKNLLSTLLLPAAALYNIAASIRYVSVKPLTLPVPVICIGGLTAGGAGKTPVALYLGNLLKEKNIGAFFLSRGYGGRLKRPTLVDPEKHTAKDVGDEPMLLARTLPTVIAADRASGARLAIASGAKAIIMDDGFQNPSLEKNLSFVVIDGETGLGNGRLLPAGPLREWPEKGLARAQAIVIINNINRALPPFPAGIPVLFAHTHAGPVTASLKGKKIIAFCGLAYPKKFFALLATAGAELIECISFPDHYRYKPFDLGKLAAQAAKQEATLVTTTKDAARLPANFAAQVTVADMTLTFDNDAMLTLLLDKVLNADAKN